MNETTKITESGIATISKIDVFWNISATVFKVAAGIILFPFVLKFFPSETVGIWTIFTAITSLIALLDFGFNPSFTRNVSYVFSGLEQLQTSGISQNYQQNQVVNYELLKGLIAAMQWFYKRGALIILTLSLTLGSYYIYYLTKNYHGNKNEVYLAWIILCVLNTYNFYTSYYGALLQGKGLVRKNKQIVIIGRCTYLGLSILLIINGAGLIAIVSAQLASMLIIRILSYRAFFTYDIKAKLANVIPQNKMDIIRTIYPNAVKIGLVICGGVAVSQSTIFIGSAFLTLSEVASFGITVQLITILITLSKLYLDTYYPKIVQYRVTNDMISLKQLYRRGKLYFLIVSVIGGGVLLLFGNFALHLIGSQTLLLPNTILIVAIAFAILDANQVLSSNILLAANEVPFLKSSLLTVLFSIILIFLFIWVFHLGVWALILAPGLSQIVYQNWKWPIKVNRLLSTS